MATANILGNGLTGISGTVAFAGTTSPTFITPVLGTPTSGILTNCTGLPIAGTTGYGTGVATALAVNTNSTGGFAVETDGTFTPVLNIGGATTGITYTTQVGAYSRIGNVVNFSMFIQLNAIGVLTGALTITGFPVVGRNTTNYFQNFAVWVSGCTLTGSPQSYISPGTSTVSLFQQTAGANAALTQTAIASASAFIIAGSYLV